MVEPGLAPGLADAKPLLSTRAIASGQTAGLNWGWLNSRRAGGQAHASSFGIHDHQVRVG